MSTNEFCHDPLNELGLSLKAIFYAENA